MRAIILVAMMAAGCVSAPGTGGEGGHGGERTGGEATCTGSLYTCQQCLAAGDACGHRELATGAETSGTCSTELECNPPCPDPACPAQ
jgi:hypothetical protein